MDKMVKILLPHPTKKPIIPFYLFVNKSLNCPNQQMFEELANHHFEDTDKTPNYVQAADPINVNSGIVTKRQYY